MNTLAPFAAALALAATPAVVQADDPGRDHGRPQAREARGDAPGPRAARPERRAEARQRRVERAEARAERRGPERAEPRQRSPGRDHGRAERRDDRGLIRADRTAERRRQAEPAREVRRDERREARLREAIRDARRDARRREEIRDARGDQARLERRLRAGRVAEQREARQEVRRLREAARYVDRPALVFARDRGLIDGCPPGLAWRSNGCRPPGQARRLARAHDDYLWRIGGGDWRYRYDDGYVYRVDPRGGLAGWLPALGGALGVGQVWPRQYTSWQPAPSYYTTYYDLEPRYQYRYADGALYGVDPRTQAIAQVAALLTGQDWSVGRPMPAGYDVYNVPWDYRDRYVDGPDRWYRYSDGYVYEVDPTTRLVMAAIQLLA